MLCQRLGIDHGPILLGEEVIIIALLVVENVIHGVRRRRADRSNRQPRVFICVVFGIHLQVFIRHRYAFFLQSVQHGDVALQRHIFIQTVDKDTGDFRAILLEERFVLYHRRKRQKLMHSHVHFFDI